MTEEHRVLVVEDLAETESELPGVVARREKHGPLVYLYWKEQGRSRSLYVPRDEVDALRTQVDTYRQVHAELLAGAARQRRAWQRRLKKGRPR